VTHVVSVSPQTLEALRKERRREEREKKVGSRAARDCVPDPVGSQHVAHPTSMNGLRSTCRCGGEPARRRCPANRGRRCRRRVLGPCKFLNRGSRSGKRSGVCCDGTGRLLVIALVLVLLARVTTRDGGCQAGRLPGSRDGRPSNAHVLALKTPA